VFAENHCRNIETGGRPQGLPFNVETVSFKLISVTFAVLCQTVFVCFALSLILNARTQDWYQIVCYYEEYLMAGYLSQCLAWLP